jgi:hypothetical protein
MILKELINKSYYTSNGYVKDINSLHILEQYIIYNLPVLKHFKGHIVANTYDGYNELHMATEKIWKKYFPECLLIFRTKNRGHGFGIADSENDIIDHCHSMKIDWILKTSSDVIFLESILNKEISGKADLYYMNGIGYGGMEKYGYNLDIIEQEDFYPQTNFYFINTTKIDYLYDKDYINETYEHSKTIPNYNNKTWEHFPGWTCEEFLKKCTQRNNLIKEHLIPSNIYKRLLKIIKENQIHDCSHKNIMIDGVCHFQYPDQPVIQI